MTSVDSSAFEAALQRDLERLALQAMDEVVAAGYKINGEAQKRTPVDGGNLRAAWKVHIQRTTDGGVVMVSNATEYAEYIEYGTKPHIIVARKKKVLADRDAGKVFGRTVRHPGTSPRPMLRPAVQAVVPQLLRRLRGMK